MKKILLFLISMVLFGLFSGCDDDVVSSNQSKLIFFAVEGKTHFPIHIVVDSDTVGIITEPSLFSGEYPSLDDSALVIVDVENGMHSYEAFTYNINGEEDFVEEGPYFEGLSNQGSFEAEGLDYYIRLNFSN